MLRRILLRCVASATVASIDPEKRNRRLLTMASIVSKASDAQMKAFFATAAAGMRSGGKLALPQRASVSSLEHKGEFAGRDVLPAETAPHPGGAWDSPMWPPRFPAWASIIFGREQDRHCNYSTLDRPQIGQDGGSLYSCPTRIPCEYPLASLRLQTCKRRPHKQNGAKLLAINRW
jgi:hypothetical protein